MAYSRLACLRSNVRMVTLLLFTLGKHGFVASLGLLLSIGLLNLAQGLFGLGYAWGLAHNPQAFQVNRDAVFFGLQLFTLYLAIIFILSRYRSNGMNNAIICHSTRCGIALGVMMMLMVGITSLVAHDDDHPMDCEYPKPKAHLPS